MTRKQSIIFSIILIALILGGIVLFYQEFSKAEYNQYAPDVTTVRRNIETSLKNRTCKITDNLPDKTCTPGSVFAVTAKEICVAGYSAKVRDVSLQTKKTIYADYEISFPQPTNRYELDHLIPLELGGDNTMENLWPESDSVPGYREKDLVENYLHDQVCKGAMELATAQQAISSDWRKVYAGLTAAQIKKLQSSFDGTN
jgi:hypothetical protein